MNNNFRRTNPAHANILNMMSEQQEKRMLAEMTGNDPLAILFNAQIREGLVDEDEILERQGPEHTMNLLDTMSCTDYSALESLTDRLAPEDSMEDKQSVNPNDRDDEFDFITPGTVISICNRTSNDLSAYEDNPLKREDGKRLILHFRSSKEFRTWKNAGKHGGPRGVSMYFTSEEQSATLAATAEHELETARARRNVRDNLPRVPFLNRAPARTTMKNSTSNTAKSKREKKEFPFLRAQDRDIHTDN